MDINGLVKKAVEEKNEKKQRDCESEVAKLVDEILSCESKILFLANNIAAYKKQLKELQLPTPMSVEL